jgi:Tfp pilus assembly protein PilW
MTACARVARFGVARGERGSGLVELMLGLMLGLSVIAVAIGSFATVNRSLSTQDGVAVVSETGQAAAAYLGKQFLQAGYVDLFADGDGYGYLAQLEGISAASVPGSGDLLAVIYAGSHPGLRSVHGCNGAYQRANALLDYTCADIAGDGTANSVSIAHQVMATPNGWQAPSLWTSFDLTRGYRSDCGARSPRIADNAAADPKGDVVINRFYLDVATQRLLCIGNGDPNSPVTVATGIEQFQVLYAVPQSSSSGAEAIAWFVPANSVDTMGPAAWGRVTAVSVCMLMRGPPGSAGGMPATNVFSLDCNGAPVNASDGRLRRAYQFTTTVRNAVWSAVALP